MPISQLDLGRYIAYLSRKLTFSSVRQYLNIVRLLHLENGHTNPLSNNWYVSSILKGVRRVKGDTCTQKLPITLELLRSIFLNLDLNVSFDRAFWAACLVGFCNIVRLLHLENGHTNPLSNNWYVSSILKGVRRVKGDTCTQKLPITLELLRSIFLNLDLNVSFDRAFWAACLVGFFSFFRKSNLLIQSPESLTHQDIYVPMMLSLPQKG